MTLSTEWSLIASPIFVADEIVCGQQDMTILPGKWLGFSEEDFFNLFGTYDETLVQEHHFVAIGAHPFNPCIVPGITPGYFAVSPTFSDTFNQIPYAIFKSTLTSISTEKMRFLISPQRGRFSKIRSTKKRIREDIINRIGKKSRILCDGETIAFNHKNIPLKARVHIEDPKGGSFGILDEITKTHILRDHPPNLITEDPPIDDPHASFIFQVDVNLPEPGFSPTFIEKRKILEVIHKHFPPKSIISPGKTCFFKDPKTGKDFRISLSQVHVGQKTYEQDTLRCFYLNPKLNPSRAFLLEHGHQVSFHAERTLSAPDILNKNEETSIDAPAKNMSFEDFLLKEGMAGCPQEVTEALLPILAYYGYDPKLREIAKNSDIKPEKGILLYGPPGNGKTTLADMLIKYLGIPEERIFKKSCTEMLDMWLGNTEKNIREPFEKAKESNELSVIFFDELDALFGERKEAVRGHERSIVAELLSRMDGLGSSPNVLVIAATNIIECIDSAPK